jgi:uncharacterized protein YchJ
MNVNTGELKALADIAEDEKGNYVEVRRDLTEFEKFKNKIALYSLCGCGSGKKFKFCCHR